MTDIWGNLGIENCATHLGKSWHCQMCDGHLENPGLGDGVTDISENPGIGKCVTDIWKILDYEIVLPMCDGHRHTRKIL